MEKQTIMTWAELKENQKLRFFRTQNSVKIKNSTFKKTIINKKERKLKVLVEKDNCEGEINLNAENFAFGDIKGIGYYAFGDEKELKLAIKKTKYERKERIKIAMKEIKEQSFLIELLNIDLGLKLKRW